MIKNIHYMKHKQHATAHNINLSTDLLGVHFYITHRKVITKTLFALHNFHLIIIIIQITFLMQRARALSGLYCNDTVGDYNLAQYILLSNVRLYIFHDGRQQSLVNHLQRVYAAHNITKNCMIHVLR